MTQPSDPRSCCDDVAALDRRMFLHTLGGAAAGLATASLWTPVGAFAAPTPQSAAETAVGRLYQSLSAEQKKVLVFPFEHELRKRISANWHITEPTIGTDFYTVEQRGLIGDIVRGLMSEDGYERLQKQMVEDAGGIEGRMGPREDHCHRAGRGGVPADGGRRVSAGGERQKVGAASPGAP